MLCIVYRWLSVAGLSLPASAPPAACQPPKPPKPPPAAAAAAASNRSVAHDDAMETALLALEPRARAALRQLFPPTLELLAELIPGTANDTQPLEALARLRERDLYTGD